MITFAAVIRNTIQPYTTSPLPLAFYRDEEWYRNGLEKIFTATWQFLFGPEWSLIQGECTPMTLLPGSLDEPLLITYPDAITGYQIMSNVCTHRGNLLMNSKARSRHITCGYHGRQFDLRGQCLKQPGLGMVDGFPGACDHLARPEVYRFHPFNFVSLNPPANGKAMFDVLNERLSFLSWDSLVHLPDQDHIYEVEAHWALYCDNYLEGLHIPFIHPTLNEALDMDRYPVEVFPGGALQIGLADEGQSCFSLPAGHPDEGSRVYAWYYWLFPNTIINVYPWGVSLNIVLPQGPTRSNVRYQIYQFGQQQDGPLSHALHQTELEDEQVVEQVMKGTRARLYRPGSLVADWESAVLHFHQMILDAFNR